MDERNTDERAVYLNRPSGLEKGGRKNKRDLQSSIICDDMFHVLCA